MIQVFQYNQALSGQTELLVKLGDPLVRSCGLRGFGFGALVR